MGSLSALRPAPHGTGKAAHLGEAEQISDLGNAHRRILQILCSEPLAGLIEQLPEAGTLLSQPALHGAQAQVERARDSGLLELTRWQKLDQVGLYAHRKLARFQAGEVMSEKLFVHPQQR